MFPDNLSQLHSTLQKSRCPSGPGEGLVTRGTVSNVVKRIPPGLCHNDSQTQRLKPEEYKTLIWRLLASRQTPEELCFSHTALLWTQDRKNLILTPHHFMAVSNFISEKDTVTVIIKTSLLRRGASGTLADRSSIICKCLHPVDRQYDRLPGG